MKSSYRNITKSDEHLQETGKRETITSSHTNYTKPILAPITAAAQSPCVNKISSNGRRRSVEKSQSFKIFSNNPSAHNSPLDTVSDRKELFNMNRPVSYKDFSKPVKGFEPTGSRDLRAVLESTSKHVTDNVTGTTIGKTNNIIQIEENIDKLVSSPFIPPTPLIKKLDIDSTVSGKGKINNINNSNVSITTIRGGGETSSQNNIATSSSEESSPVKSPGLQLRRRSSSSKMEKSPSVGSLNTLASEECKVPEFMRIHLNRVENTRPKSSIVLYKGTSDTLPRRFSRGESDATKPPLPPALNVATLKRPSINKSQETITESNHVIIVPVISPRKASMESSPGVLPKPTEISPPIQSNVISSSSSSCAKTMSTPCPAPEPVKSTTVPATKQPEVVVLRESFSERKGSVSEEKAKIERRLSIADEKSVVRKKSIPTASNGNPLKGSNKEDNTPELMKVFARRSMKLKDDDDDVPLVVQKSDSQSSVITDSDKENHSSSREELSCNNNNKSIITEEDVLSGKEQSNKSSPPYHRPRTFLEVKNMLQSTNNNNNNGNTVQSNKSIVGSVNNVVSGLRAQKSLPLGGQDTIRKESPRNSVSETIVSPATTTAATVSDSDKLPEFKRIVERREEWESRAKMWK